MTLYDVKIMILYSFVFFFWQLARSNFCATEAVILMMVEFLKTRDDVTAERLIRSYFDKCTKHSKFWEFVTNQDSTVYNIFEYCIF